MSESTRAIGITTWNDLVRERWLGSAEPAVISRESVWSGDELLRRAGGAAAWLSAAGFPVGAPVPAVLDESPLAIALAVGASLGGRPLAPLGTKLPPDDLAVALSGVDAMGVVATLESAPAAAEAARRAGCALHVLGENPSSADLPDVASAPDDVALVVHTSGTTGAPKPVRIRHHELLARIGTYAGALTLGPGDRYCSASPFYHTAGVAMVFTALGAGAAVIPQAWFSVEGWRLAGRLGMSCALLVPTMIDLLLAAGALADARPRVLQYGAAPIDPATLTEALRALAETRFIQIFGQTEVSPISVLSHADHLRALDDRVDLLGSVGRPVSGLELCVEGAGDDGVGELAVRAPHVFVADPDGWRRTGDLGRLDEEGYLWLRGRVHDRIVRGGENIYPLEVERALSTHSGVRDVAVVGMPDRRWGEIVKAAIVPADPSAPPSAEELSAHARARLAHFKVPEIFEVVPELPRNASGKVLRRKLVG